MFLVNLFKAQNRSNLFTTSYAIRNTENLVQDNQIYKCNDKSLLNE